jgi:NADPH:quinone reductase-like Zn-dependent oxidoreductase
MAPTNLAAVLTSPDSSFTVSEAPYSTPYENEIVVKVHAIAINPADTGIQKVPGRINHYPAILGCDVAGEVVEVGNTAAKHYNTGDRVVGAASPLRPRPNGLYATSGFQQYVVITLPAASKIPAGVAYTDASVLPLATNTAASCLFPQDMLGLDLPVLENKPTGSKGTLLVWGASSSVGIIGVQLARAAGYHVLGIASTHNHDLVRSAGATTVFDQAEGDLISKVTDHLKSTDTPIVGAYAAIANEATLVPLCEILHACTEAGLLTRKFIASVFPNTEQYARHGVEIKLNFASALGDDKSVERKVWQWVEHGLASGEMKCLPPPQVVGNGLESVDGAVEMMKRGVSGKKLVVALE